MWMVSCLGWNSTLFMTRRICIFHIIHFSCEFSGLCCINLPRQSYIPFMHTLQSKLVILYELDGSVPKLGIVSD